MMLALFGHLGGSESSDDARVASVAALTEATVKYLGGGFGDPDAQSVRGKNPPGYRPGGVALGLSA